MNGILRLDERLRDAAWPGLRKTDVPNIGPRDCLIVCAGFEERATEVLRRLVAGRHAKFHVGLVKYQPYVLDNRLDELRAAAQNGGVRCTELLYDRSVPEGMGETVAHFAEQHDRVFVDVSGMSRLLIVQTIVALWNRLPGGFTILYCEPWSYWPSRERYERDRGQTDGRRLIGYLSAGILEIVATPELSSVAMLGEAIRLVAFPSFSPTQLERVVQELQPTYVDFIHGIPPDLGNKWRSQAVRETNIATLEDVRNRTGHSVSTMYYEETLRKLLDIYDRRSAFDKLVISPTGSKMQAVAVGIFRAVLADVQIVYPTPESFTDRREYTRGVRCLYQLELPIDVVGTGTGTGESERAGDEMGERA